MNINKLPPEMQEQLKKDLLLLQQEQQPQTEQDTDTQEQDEKPTLEKFDYIKLGEFLKRENITAKYNLITHEIEIEVHGELFKSENRKFIKSNIPTLLESQLTKEYKGVTIDRICRSLAVVATNNAYNPILELIKSTKWDGKDYLTELYNMFNLCVDNQTDPTLKEKHTFYQIVIKKWLMQCICGLHNDMDNPFSLDIVLVFQGQQGIGKTRFFEKLSLNSNYFGEGKAIDLRDKDTKIDILTKWICELGEIGSTMKKDIDIVKAFLSSSSDTYRVPYGRTYDKYPRLTSFCGSVNETEFLVDTTGNRRFATVQLPNTIGKDFIKKVKNFNALQLWTQIDFIVEQAIKEEKETYSSCFRLTYDEIAILQKYNSQHEKPLKGENEVKDVLFKLSNYSNVKYGYITVTQFIQNNPVLRNINSRQVGKILQKLGYKPIQKRLNCSSIPCIVYNLPYVEISSSF